MQIVKSVHLRAADISLGELHSDDVLFDWLTTENVRSLLRRCSFLYLTKVYICKYILRVMRTPYENQKYYLLAGHIT